MARIAIVLVLALATAASAEDFGGGFEGDMGPPDMIESFHGGPLDGLEIHTWDLGPGGPMMPGGEFPGGMMGGDPFSGGPMMGGGDPFFDGPMSGGPFRFPAEMFSMPPAPLFGPPGFDGVIDPTGMEDLIFELNRGRNRSAPRQDKPASPPDIRPVNPAGPVVTV